MMSSEREVSVTVQFESVGSGVVEYQFCFAPGKSGRLEAKWVWSRDGAVDGKDADADTINDCLHDALTAGWLTASVCDNRAGGES